MPNPTATFLASMMEGHFEASKAARLAMSSAAAPAAPRFGIVTNAASRSDNGWSGGSSVPSSLPDEANDESYAARERSLSRDRQGESGDEFVSAATGTLGSLSASSASSSSPSGRRRDDAM